MKREEQNNPGIPPGVKAGLVFRPLYSPPSRFSLPHNYCSNPGAPSRVTIASIEKRDF